MTSNILIAISDNWPRQHIREFSSHNLELWNRLEYQSVLEECAFP